MKFSIAAAAIFAALASAQSLAGLPTCADNCVLNGIPASCNLDPKCICSTASFITAISCCVSKACDKADQVKVLKYAKGICDPVGITNLPTAATCAGGASTIGTSSSSASSMAASSSGSSSMSMTSTAAAGSSSISSGAAGSVKSSLTTASGSVVASVSSSGATAGTTQASQSAAATGNAAAMMPIWREGMAVLGGAAIGVAMM